MNLKIVSRRLCFYLVIVVLASVAVSCTSPSTAGNAPNETTTTAPTVTVSPAELINQADQLYAQRDDLARVRDGLAKLRGARAAEPNNYEAAWRLAKFNYYLGDNTTNAEERDKAFEDGVAAA